MDHTMWSPTLTLDVFVFFSYCKTKINTVYMVIIGVVTVPVITLSVGFGRFFEVSVFDE